MPPECPTCLLHHASTERCRRDPDEVKGEKMRRLRADNERIRGALNDVLFMVEDANGNLTSENLGDIRDCVMSALDLA